MKLRVAIILVLFLILATKTFARDGINEGQKIFLSRCASCHAVDKKLVGPALRGIRERRDINWIGNFVHSSQTMIKNGDPDAVALFNEYNKTVMPDHPDLSTDQIGSILAYIKMKSETIVADRSSSVSYVKPYKNKKSVIDRIVYLNLDKEQRPIRKDDYKSWILIATIVVVLVSFLYVVLFSKKLLSRVKENYPENSQV